jgi:hypothetical protein
MSPWWLISFTALWLVVLPHGFLLLGTLRALGLLCWRLEQPGDPRLSHGLPLPFSRGGAEPRNSRSSCSGNEGVSIMSWFSTSTRQNGRQRKPQPNLA